MLYLLERKERPCNIGLDETVKQLIRASTENRARKIANKRGNTGDEGHIWEDPKEVKCTRLKLSGKEGQIIQEYTAG